jgi:hypothetical protein
MVAEKQLKFVFETQEAENTARTSPSYTTPVETTPVDAGTLVKGGDFDLTPLTLRDTSMSVVNECYGQLTDGGRLTALEAFRNFAAILKMKTMMSGTPLKNSPMLARSCPMRT